jgi:hypothetical protein
MRPLALVFSAAGVIAALAACGPTKATPQPVPTAHRTPSPTRVISSPTPALEAAFEKLGLTPGQPPDAWTAIGLLTNQSHAAVQDVAVRVRLLDANDNLLDQSDVRLALPLLGPLASAPFSAGFASLEGTHVAAEIVGYEHAQATPAPIDIEITRQMSTGDGRLAVMGEMTNPSASSVRVLGVALTASASDGALVGVSSNWMGIAGLSPGEAAPFLAILPPPATQVTHVVAYPAAEAWPDPPSSSPVKLLGQPTLESDEQGNPVVLGMVHNVSPMPAPARLMVTLMGPDGLASASMYASPIPLAPDETRAFALSDFPGLSAQLASGAEKLAGLRPRALVDPYVSSAPGLETLNLRVEITAFETIGGGIFVHGSAYNQNDRVVLQPTVIGSLLGASGEVWSAGEVNLGKQMDAGSEADFLLVMPKPAGVTPSEGEFDIRGLGLAP